MGHTTEEEEEEEEEERHLSLPVVHLYSKLPIN